MTQVVGVGADRVRAVAGVRQVGQELVDQLDFGAGVIEKENPTDYSAITFLDHPHTGLPRRRQWIRRQPSRPECRRLGVSR
jgi:hypothetical protein